MCTCGAAQVLPPPPLPMRSAAMARRSPSPEPPQHLPISPAATRLSQVSKPWRRSKMWRVRVAAPSIRHNRPCPRAGDRTAGGRAACAIAPRGGGDGCSGAHRQRGILSMRGGAGCLGRTLAHRRLATLCGPLDARHSRIHVSHTSHPILASPAPPTPANATRRTGFSLPSVPGPSPDVLARVHRGARAQRAHSGATALAAAPAASDTAALEEAGLVELLERLSLQSLLPTLRHHEASALPTKRLRFRSCLRTRSSWR